MGARIVEALYGGAEAQAAATELILSVAGYQPLLAASRHPPRRREAGRR